MGMDADAKLFYGICEMEEHDWELPEELIDRENGIRRWIDLWDSMDWKKQEEMAKEYGIYVYHHCCSEQTMWLVAINRTCIYSEWGSPKTAIMEEPTQEEMIKLNKALDILHVPVDKRNYGWWLVAYYG